VPVFNPTLISVPQAAPVPEPVQVAPIAPAPIVPTVPAPAPIPVQAPPQQVFIPVPVMQPPPPKVRGMRISPEAIRKSQTLYPAEQNEKQTMIQNAKAPPTPTGAWGAPA
jgi:hypothetical protein